MWAPAKDCQFWLLLLGVFRRVLRGTGQGYGPARLQHQQHDWPGAIHAAGPALATTGRQAHPVERPIRARPVALLHNTLTHSICLRHLCDTVFISTPACQKWKHSVPRPSTTDSMNIHERGGGQPHVCQSAHTLHRLEKKRSLLSYFDCLGLFSTSCKHTRIIIGCL